MNIMETNGEKFDISKDEALNLLGNDSTLVLDVRTQKEIIIDPPLVEDAIIIDYRSEEFETEVKKLDKNRTYLVVCGSGTRSRDACITMEKNGFKSVKNLKGGLNTFYDCPT